MPRISGFSSKRSKETVVRVREKSHDLSMAISVMAKRCARAREAERGTHEIGVGHADAGRA
jgi:hypothetical protein